MKSIKSLGGRLLLVASSLLFIAAADSPADAPADSSAPPATVVKPATGNLPPEFKPSPALQPIVTLAQSGVSETILMAYINNQGLRVALTPEEIVFLRDLGLSDEVITTLMLKPEGTPTVLASAQAPAPAPVVSNLPLATNAVAVGAGPPAPVGVDMTKVEQPAQPVTTNQFVDALAPYGSWVNISGYGLAWQPTVVVINSSWRPYADCGRWVWSNHGWYWDSDYSWGWAPFHYGRWYCHPTLSWVWFPDTHWGPSWVSWRYSPSYCGWAPLPPTACYRPGIGFSYYNRSVGVSFEFGLGSSSYCFVPTRNFCHPRPRDHVVPHDRNVALYHSTTVVNNYVTEQNNVIINRGIGRDAIANVAPSRIPEVEIRNARGPRGPEATPGRIQRTSSGRSIVYRPEAPVTTPAAAGNETPAPVVRSGSSRNLFSSDNSSRTPGSRSLITRPAEAPTTITAPTSLPSTAPSTPAAPTLGNINPPAANNPDSRPGRGPQRNQIALPNGSTRTPVITENSPPIVRPTEAPVIRSETAGNLRPLTPRPQTTTRTFTAPSATPPAAITTSPTLITRANPPSVTPTPTPAPAVINPPAPVSTPAPVTTPSTVPALPQRYGTPTTAPTVNLTSAQRDALQQFYAQRNVTPPPNPQKQANVELYNRLRQSMPNQPAPQSVPTDVKPSVINSVPVGVKPSVTSGAPVGVAPSVKTTAPVGVPPSVNAGAPTGVRPSISGTPNYNFNGRPSTGPTYNNRGGPQNRP
jgi:hypothetical protein